LLIKPTSVWLGHCSGILEVHPANMPRLHLVYHGFTVCLLIMLGVGSEDFRRRIPLGLTWIALDPRHSSCGSDGILSSDRGFATGGYL
jgi:hypothetical protein